MRPTIYFIAIVCDSLANLNEDLVKNWVIYGWFKEMGS